MYLCSTFRILTYKIRMRDIHLLNIFLAYFPYYFLVCLVDFRHINRVQIHLRCLYGVMPHALADYWNGYVHVSRYACPCMPRAVYVVSGIFNPVISPIFFKL